MIGTSPSGSGSRETDYTARCCKPGDIDPLPPRGPVSVHTSAGIFPSYFSERYSRSTDTLSRARSLLSMLILIECTLSTGINASHGN